jgi:sugar phosphate isomerase/epimerase
MRLQIFRSLWGVVGGHGGGVEAKSAFTSLPDALSAIKALGYDGVETPLKFVLQTGSDEFTALLRQYKLRLNVQIFTDGPVAPGDTSGLNIFGGPYSSHPPPGDSVDEHVAVLRAQVAEALKLGDVVNLINCHSGKDWFDDADADAFFSAAVDVERELITTTAATTVANAKVNSSGGDGAAVVPICHETHRGRLLYSPWLAGKQLEKQPAIKVCADLSHWLCVAETTPDDTRLKSVVEEVIAPRTHHIHCRVGHAEGPQVPDPADPFWTQTVEGHEALWDLLWAAQAKRGDAFTTLIPEHGPPGYQVCLPYSQMPLCDLWKANHWLALRQQERFARIYGEENTSRLIPLE